MALRVEKYRLDHLRFERSLAFFLPPYVGHIFGYPPFVTIYYVYFFSNIIKSIFQGSNFEFPCWENFTSVWPWIVLGFFSRSINYLGISSGYFSTRIAYLDDADAERKSYTYDLEQACADPDDRDLTIQLKKESAQYVANPGRSYSRYSRMSCACVVFAFQSCTFFLYCSPFLWVLRHAVPVPALWFKGLLLLELLLCTWALWDSGKIVGRMLKRGCFGRELRISALKGASDTYASWENSDEGTER